MQLFLVPPTLRAIPTNGQVAARKGSTVTLECKASGNFLVLYFQYLNKVISCNVVSFILVISERKKKKNNTTIISNC